MDRKKVIQVEALSTHFDIGGDVIKAVDSISFNLFEGEVLGIVGESGSGKSVTSLSIMRLIDEPGEIVAGQVIFKEDVDLISLTEREMRSYRGKEIGLIFQEPMSAMNPSYTCGNQLMEVVQLHLYKEKEKAKEHLFEILKRVGILDPVRVFESYPHQLSGGQLQRVMIAMAIACRPSVIIADEPTTALDVTVQKKVLQLFKEIKNELDTSLIFISHDLGVISEIADRVLVMFKGEIVEQGPLETIFTRPSHPYTKGLIACRPDPRRHVSRLPTISDFMETSFQKNSWTVVEKTVMPSFPEITSLESDQRAENLKENGVLLEVNNMTVSYTKSRSVFNFRSDRFNAVDDVSFTIFKGETLGLVGESGSGKSSIGKAMLNLIPYKGSVVYDGQEIAQLKSKEMKPYRKKLQIIFQDPFSSLNPRMKVGTAIAEVLEVHGFSRSKEVIRQRVEELLLMVGMERNHYERYPHEFSGGQRQRICIARTLAVEPEFIVCDESVAALDVSVQAQVLNLLKDLQNKLNLTYLFISHDLSIVKHMSDRVMVLKEGKLMEVQSAQDIYNNPITDYTKNLIDAIPGKSFNFL